MVLGCDGWGARSFVGCACVCVRVLCQKKTYLEWKGKEGGGRGGREGVAILPFKSPATLEERKGRMMEFGVSARLRYTGKCEI